MFDNNNISDRVIITPAQRVEGCALVNMKKVVDANSGASSVIFKFTGPGGSELEHREFEPSRKIGDKTLNDEEFKKNIGLVHSRIAHISRAFLDEATFLKIKIQDTGLDNFRAMWNDYIKQTAMALEVGQDGSVGKAKGVVCALKVIYRTTKGKNYASLPNVPTFISTPNHPKEFTTNPQYDKYTIEKVTPDTEHTNNAGGGGGEAAPGFTSGGASSGHPSGF